MPKKYVPLSLAHPVCKRRPGNTPKARRVYLEPLHATRLFRIVDGDQQRASLIVGIEYAEEGRLHASTLSPF
jgi:hypothetical protein